MKKEGRGEGKTKWMRKKIVIIVYISQGRSKSHFKFYGISLEYCRLWVLHSHWQAHSSGEDGMKEDV